MKVLVAGGAGHIGRVTTGKPEYADLRPIVESAWAIPTATKVNRSPNEY